jgi:hypothetical protein
LSGSRGVSIAGTLAQSTPQLRNERLSKSSLKDAASASTSTLPFQAPNNHTLMQMLNLMGNRILEAEGNGMVPLLEEEEPRSSKIAYRGKSLDRFSSSDGDGSPIPLKKKSLFSSLIIDECKSFRSVLLCLVL